MAEEGILSTADFLKKMRKTPLGNTTSLTLGEASLLSDMGIDPNADGATTDIVQTEKESQSFWDDIFGTIDNIANSFGKGFVSAFEGIVDFGAMLIGNAVDAFGGDSSGIQDFIEVDIASNLANFTETFANFTPWGLVKMNINFWETGGFGGDYWNDAMKAWSSIGTGAWGDVTDSEFKEWQEEYTWGHDILEEKQDGLVMLF